MPATIPSVLTVRMVLPCSNMNSRLIGIETEMKNAAWYYPVPKDKAANIKEYVAFGMPSLSSMSFDVSCNPPFSFSLSRSLECLTSRLRDQRCLLVILFDADSLRRQEYSDSDNCVGLGKV